MAVSYNVGTFLCYDSFADLPAVGSSGLHYWTPDTGTYWSWTGSSYVSAHSSPSAPRVTSITSSATPAINVATTDLFEITALAAVITGFTITGTPLDGQTLNVRILDAGTGKGITWEQRRSRRGRREGLCLPLRLVLCASAFNSFRKVPGRTR